MKINGTTNLTNRSNGRGAGGVERKNNWDWLGATDPQILLSRFDLNRLC